MEVGEEKQGIPTLEEQKAYLDRVEELMFAHLPTSPSWFTKTTVNSTRLLLIDGGQEKRFDSSRELLRYIPEFVDMKQPTVCIVENISRDGIGLLGSAWDLDPEFFVIHASNPKLEDMWKMNYDYGPKESNDTYKFLDGIFQYHGIATDQFEMVNSSPKFFPRYCLKIPRRPMESNTRISYCRTNDLYIFLVDAPLDMEKHGILSPKMSPSLRFMYSLNCEGVMLPQLLPLERHDRNIFEKLSEFFSHEWHVQLLFYTPSRDRYREEALCRFYPGLGPHIMAYLLSRSVWETNLNFLSKEIHRISFEDIRNPSFTINNTLHDRREDLARLKTGLLETISWVPNGVRVWFEENLFFDEPHYGTKRPRPLEDLERILAEANKLEEFLMQTFQPLMSSISILDS